MKGELLWGVVDAEDCPTKGRLLPFNKPELFPSRRRARAEAKQYGDECMQIKTKVQRFRLVPA